MSWWLIGDDGVRRRLGPQGLVLGRSEDCDLVLADPKASSIHAALMVTGRGPELRGIGRNPTLVDGRPVTGAVLQDGASIQLPGASFKLVRGATDPPRWVLQWGLQRFGLRGGPLLVGSSPDVDLLLPGWPPQAFVLTVLDSDLVIEALAPVLLGGQQQQPGAVETLDAGDHIGWQGEDLILRLAVGGPPPPTQRARLPTTVRFDFLPTGGRLALSFPTGRHVQLELPELRARLVSTLLRPPGGHLPGEFVPDDLVLDRIWPGDTDRDHTDLDALMHRTRQDLLRAGISPSPLLGRAPGGRATAFRIAAGASVSVA